MTARDIRKNQGLSAEDVASAMGCTAATVRRIEREGTPCERTMRKMARIVGCDLSHCLRGMRATRRGKAEKEAKNSLPDSAKSRRTRQAASAQSLNPVPTPPTMEVGL
jgi:transcriptional regulator with XRE-family HTH domain